MLTCTAKGKTFSWTVWLCTCCARMILLPCSVLIPCSLWCDRIVPRLVIRERALRAAMRSGCHCCLSVAVHGERSVQQRTLRKVPAFNSLPVRPRCDLVRRQRSPSHVQHPRHNSLLSRPRPGPHNLDGRCNLLLTQCQWRMAGWLLAQSTQIQTSHEERLGAASAPAAKIEIRLGGNRVRSMAHAGGSASGYCQAKPFMRIEANLSFIS
jgi:hypothetical protein